MKKLTKLPVTYLKQVLWVPAIPSSLAPQSKGLRRQTVLPGHLLEGPQACIPYNSLQPLFLPQSVYCI